MVQNATAEIYPDIHNICQETLSPALNINMDSLRSIISAGMISFDKEDIAFIKKRIDSISQYITVHNILSLIEGLDLQLSKKQTQTVSLKFSTIPFLFLH